MRTIQDHSRSSFSRAGFSFAEVMFAVVILGIGFIMVAAVFPVAIQQTQSTGEENIAASIARQAAAAIASLPMTYANPIYNPAYDHTLVPPPAASVPTLLTFPPTVKNYVKGNTVMEPNAADAPAIVVPLLGARWNFSKTISILPSDPRYAYAAFYKRGNNTSTVELIVIAMAARNRPTYSSNLDELSAQQQQTSPPPATVSSTTGGDFPPQLAHTVICPDTMTVPAATEGVSLQFPSNLAAPQLTGRTYSVGRAIPNSTLFEVMAGDGMALTPGIDGKWGTKGRTADDPIATAVAVSMNWSSTIQPVVAYATLKTTPDAPLGRIQLSVLPPIATPNVAPVAATTGAFVIIADDFPALPGMTSSGGAAADYCQQPNNLGYTVGSMNGRIFRLGAAVPPSPPNSVTNPYILPGTFNLDPAYGMSPVPAGGISPDTLPNQAMLNAIPAGDPDQIPLSTCGCAKVYIIGVGKTDPASLYPTYSGAAQDIGAFVSFIQVQ